MMNRVPWLQITNMISYQGLVRPFPNSNTLYRWSNPDKAGESDTVEKHYNIALRRLKNGQYFYQPTLGTREFAASFELIEHTSEIPKSNIQGEVDLGYMLYDMNFSVNESKTKQSVSPSFFRAKLEDGILDLRNAGNEVRI